MQIDRDRLAAASDEASEFLKSLASPVRLRILCLIAGKEASVGEIAEALGARHSLVSQHLGLLRRDGLVNARRDGQTIWYALADERAATILRTLQTIFCPAPDAGAGDAPPAAAPRIRQL